MPTLIELEQLLDIALTTPEIGTVNFNILRVFLQEILKHLNIENKPVDIDNLDGKLKSASDFIKDGFVEISSKSRERTPESAQKQNIIIETEPEKEIAKEETEEEQSTSGTPVMAAVEEKKSPELKSMLELKGATPSPKPGTGLSVRDHTPTTRNSVLLVGRTDSLKNLKRMVSELQERVETLELQPAPMPDPVKSAASLVRKESRTPAHDFVELINIKRKLEASENSIDGLTEMVDALTSDVNELKELMANADNASANNASANNASTNNASANNASANNTPSDTTCYIEELKNCIEALKRENGKNEGQIEEISQQLQKLSYSEKKLDELEGVLTSLKAAMEELKNNQNCKDQIQVNEKDQDQEPTDCTPSAVSKALEKLEKHEKQLEELAAQIQLIEGKIHETDARFDGTEQAASDALVRLEACAKGVNEIRDQLVSLTSEIKKHKSLIEDNEMQINQLKNTITLLQRKSPEKANEEAEKSKVIIEEKPTEPAQTPAPRLRTHSVDRDELSLIRAMIFDLQEEKDKLKQTDTRLSDELYKKQKHLDDLYNLINELRDVKADKDLLSMGFDLKADKREVDAKIGRQDFEHYMSLVDQSLRDLLQRLDGQEDALRRALEGLNSDVGKKLDKEEVEPLKHYLEKRMEAMKPKPIEKPPPEEFAAGIRKQFLVNHNCISCDSPVKYAREGTFPPLPIMRSMPGSKSNRPYTTFELEQIRQHMLQGGLAMTKERFELLERQRNKLQKEILRLSGVRNLQELAEVTARACGGVHTLTYPHSQAVVRGLQLNRDDFDLILPQKDFQPVDILGQDGHIYKGLLENLPPMLPHIPPKNKSPGINNPPRNLRRRTPPTSPSVQKTLPDEAESS